jgi:hypothetical protein
VLHSSSQLCRIIQKKCAWCHMVGYHQGWWRRPPIPFRSGAYHRMFGGHPHTASSAIRLDCLVRGLGIYGAALHLFDSSLQQQNIEHRNFCRSIVTSIEDLEARYLSNPAGSHCAPAGISLHSNLSHRLTSRPPFQLIFRRFSRGDILSSRNNNLRRVRRP